MAHRRHLQTENPQPVLYQYPSALSTPVPRELCTHCHHIQTIQSILSIPFAFSVIPYWSPVHAFLVRTLTRICGQWLYTILHAYIAFIAFIGSCTRAFLYQPLSILPSLSPYYSPYYSADVAGSVFRFLLLSSLAHYPQQHLVLGYPTGRPTCS